MRLPIRSIAKSKLVCKRWRLLIESAIFRGLFVSLHKQSSCSWSLLSNDNGFYGTVERIALYGCKKWGLARSLSSYISSPPVFDSKVEIKPFRIKASASGLLLIQIEDNIYCVGNPVLRKWVKIRPCTLSLKNYYSSRMCGLATRVENDVVLGYKVILGYTYFQGATRLSFQVYSSETGEWTCEHIHCPCPLPWSEYNSCNPISLNGMLHWVDAGGRTSDDAGGMVVVDFYNEGANRCRVIKFPKQIKFPLNCHPKLWSRRACSVSGGFIVYIDAISICEDHRLKVWKLNHLLKWESSWEIDLTSTEFGISAIPMAMHPFDTSILYSMSREKKCMMSINLRTKKSMLHKDSDNNGCNINIFKCPEVMFQLLRVYLLWQFVPSPWMDDVPHPPPCAHCGRP